VPVVLVPVVPAPPVPVIPEPVVPVLPVPVAVLPVPVAPDVEDVPVPVDVPVAVLDWPRALPVVPVCPAALPVPGVLAFGFTAAEPPVAGAGEGEFSVPSLPAVVPALPVPEYAPVLSRAVPVPGPSAPGEPVPGCVVPAVPVPIGAPAFPPMLPAPEVPADVPELEPLEDCASAVTGQSVAAPASTPVPTHLHAVRFMTVAFSRRSDFLPTR